MGKMTLQNVNFYFAYSQNLYQSATSGLLEDCKKVRNEIKFPSPEK